MFEMSPLDSYVNVLMEIPCQGLHGTKSSIYTLSLNITWHCFLLYTFCKMLMFRVMAYYADFLYLNLKFSHMNVMETTPSKPSMTVYIYSECYYLLNRFPAVTCRTN